MLVLEIVGRVPRILSIDQTSASETELIDYFFELSLVVRVPENRESRIG